MNLELEELRVSSQEVIQRLKDEIRGIYRLLLKNFLLILCFLFLFRSKT